jgi:DNA polymerase-3 subunit alpha
VIRWLFLTLSDFTGSTEAVVFPKTYAQNKDDLHEDAIIAVQAKVSDRDGQKSIIVEGIKLLSERRETEAQEEE